MNMRRIEQQTSYTDVACILDGGMYDMLADFEACRVAKLKGAVGGNVVTVHTGGRLSLAQPGVDTRQFTLIMGEELPVLCEILPREDGTELVTPVSIDYDGVSLRVTIRDGLKEALGLRPSPPVW